MQFAIKNRTTLHQFSIKTTKKSYSKPIIDTQILVKMRRHLRAKIGVTLRHLDMDKTF